MIVLDSDHISILEHPESPQYAKLTDAMNASTDGHFVSTVVTLEEQARGWLAAIHRAKQVHDQPLYYTRLAGLVRFFSRWELLLFDEPAADKFVELRRKKIRVSTMDLKIASIALVRNVTLLSANLRDFEEIPGLKVEDWLRPGN